MEINIGIASDHAGFKYKNRLFNVLKHFYNITDYGCLSENSVDYTDFANKIAKNIQLGKIKQGILICGTGNGMAMAANKFKGVIAGIAWNKDIAKLIRQHNNANILCLPARFMKVDKCLEIVKIFLNTDFEGGRHLRRIKKI